jgi:hypothetical protein
LLGSALSVERGLIAFGDGALFYVDVGCWPLREKRFSLKHRMHQYPTGRRVRGEGVMRRYIFASD